MKDATGARIAAGNAKKEVSRRCKSAVDQPGIATWAGTSIAFRLRACRLRSPDRFRAVPML
jgi:hypothetical protein